MHEAVHVDGRCHAPESVKRLRRDALRTDERNEVSVLLVITCQEMSDERLRRSSSSDQRQRELVYIGNNNID